MSRNALTIPLLYCDTNVSVSLFHLLKIRYSGDMEKHGYFVISLDFELFWGMSDKHTIAEYGARVFGERTAIPRMLDLFRDYDIHATWATVGMLMAHTKKEFLSYLPPEEKRPVYTDPRLSTYHHILTDGIGHDESDDPYHYGPTLVELILKTPKQELANHTFSHYYCMDEDSVLETTFGADLDAHARICELYRIKTHSIVFPRNQMNGIALRVAQAHGMHTYRGTEQHFLYRSRKEKAQSYFIRALRLIDHYINISGNHTYPLPSHKERIVNIPASRFLRPYMPLLSFLEPLRMRRIKRAMTHAATHGEVFHLWWHPHNFGIHQDENFRNLYTILEHYTMLHKTHGMESASMQEIGTLALNTQASS